MTNAASSPERPLVVTGAGGFVGLRLVQALLVRGHAVIGIGRGEQLANWPDEARWVRADLADVAGYESALKGAACVLHLAAVTGKARPAAYRRGNVEATRALNDASVRAGASRFIFVSSIAAAFPDRRHYPYADSKIAAEQIVRDAPIASVIVRPTMILGPGSPIEESLAKLARLPLSPIFGDGANRVQPVDVDDVVELLANLAADEQVAGETLEVGGRDTYSMCDLYARLREAHGGKGAPSFVHAPLGLSRWGLALIEGPLLPLMPLTAGQLATFANDSVAERHDAVRRLLPNPRQAPRSEYVRESLPPLPPPPADPATLTEELKRNARYVAGVEPSAYQITKYIDFHQKRGFRPANAFDALLLRVARISGVGLALADSYSGLLYRTSIVRAKLVLALAILETSPPSFAKLDRPEASGVMAYLGMALRGAMAAFSVLAGALFLLPAQIILGRRPARP